MGKFFPPGYLDPRKTELDNGGACWQIPLTREQDIHVASDPEGKKYFKVAVWQDCLYIRGEFVGIVLQIEEDWESIGPGDKPVCVGLRIFVDDPTWEPNCLEKFGGHIYQVGKPNCVHCEKPYDDAVDDYEEIDLDF